MEKYLIAHDLGTTGNKATLFSTTGKLIKSITHGYKTNFFNGNWADQRSIVEENILKNKIDEKEFYNITGHKISASYSIEKLMWIRDNEPDIFKKVYKILNPKDYIIYRLTGELVTDYSDTSSTNAFDIINLKWSEKILEYAELDIELFPNVYPSIHVAGTVPSTIADECGLAPGTKVVIGGGDGVCAAVGAGSVKENISYNYLGSSSWVAYTSKKPVFDKDMRTFIGFI